MVPVRRQRTLSWLGLATVLCGALAVESPLLVRAGDDLDSLRTEARTSGWSQPASTPPSEPNHQSANNWDDQDSFFDDDDESWLDGEWIVGAVVIAAAPFWGPACLVGDDYSSPAYFPRYPYQQPLDGHLMIEPNVPRKPREWSGRVQFEQGGDFDNLISWNGGLLLETTSRFGIDSRVRYMTQNRNGTNDDHLGVGDANLLFRFAQSPNLEMRTGLGFNWLADDVGSDFGFNFTYGGDWYPVRPLIVSGEIDWGELGHASLFHARITTGVEWHRAEIYVGYDYLDLGNSQLDTWLGGVRIWF